MRGHVEECSLQNGPARVVEIDIDPVWAGRSELLSETGRLVVDSLVNIEVRAEDVALLLRACLRSAVSSAAAQGKRNEGNELRELNA